MKNRKYEIAGHLFEVSGEELVAAMSGIEGFKPFEATKGEPLFHFMEGASEDVPAMVKEQYTFDYEDVHGSFGSTKEGFRLSLKPEAEEPFELWCNLDARKVWLQGNWSMYLYRFALWVGYGLMTLPYDTVAIHSSCNVIAI